MLIASSFLLWIVTALLTVAVLAMSRQIALLRDALTANASRGRDGVTLAVGDVAPDIPAVSVDGQVLAIGPSGRHGRWLLLFFVGPGCPACRRAIPIVQRVAARESLDLVFVADCGAEGARAIARRYRLDGRPLTDNAAIVQAFGVASLPHAVLIRADGVIAARGTAATREQVDALIIAAELTGEIQTQPPIVQAAGRAA